MVADARFQITGPVRQAIGSVLYPVQWLVFQPVELARHGSGSIGVVATGGVSISASTDTLTITLSTATGNGGRSHTRSRDSHREILLRGLPFDGDGSEHVDLRGRRQSSPGDGHGGLT